MLSFSDKDNTIQEIKQMFCHFLISVHFSSTFVKPSKAHKERFHAPFSDLRFVIFVTPYGVIFVTQGVLQMLH